MSEDQGERGREEQLAYSEIMAKMLDEEARRKKAAKIVAVVRHALGVETLAGLQAVDVGCSAGFIADELALAGATTSGVDIDEPGLEKARARFGERVDFRLARGEDLPFDDASVDVAVLNHIYEHVVDPEAVVADIHRVLRPGGVLYLGIGHRWQVSSRTTGCRSCPGCPAVPPTATCGSPAGRSLLRALLHPGRAASPLRRLRRLGLHASRAHRPAAFAADDNVPAWAAKVPPPVFRAALPLVPTYVWAAFKGLGARRSGAARPAPHLGGGGGGTDAGPRRRPVPKGGGGGDPAWSAPPARCPSALCSRSSVAEAATPRAAATPRGGGSPGARPTAP